MVADTRGRRFSFLLGAGTLLVSTLLYLVMWELRAGLLGWALASILLGLGFTFFSGATEAWLVDALAATGFTGTLESVFARAQIGQRRRDARRAPCSAAFVAQADQPRRPLPAPGRPARRDPADRVAIHARPRVHARPGRQRDRRGARRPPGVDRRRLSQPAGPLDHARGAVHRRRRDLRLLCPPAVSAAAVRRSDRLRRRRPGRRDRRRRPDRRRPHRDPGAPPVPAADRCPHHRRASPPSCCWP